MSFFIKNSLFTCIIRSKRYAKSGKMLRRFTKGGGGCRRLRGWRVFDGFESYAGK